MSVLEFSEEQIVNASRPSRITLRYRPPVAHKTRATAGEIARRVALAHGVTAEEMLAHNHTRHLAAARAELYRALRDQNWSYPAIGDFVGRDQSTVRAALLSPAAKVERKVARVLKAS